MVWTSPTRDSAAFSVLPVGADGNEPLLEGSALIEFQDAVAARGALPAYHLTDGSFAVIDAGATPVLEVVAEAMQGDADARRAFIADAPRLIEEALEARLRAAKRIKNDTSPEASAELVATSLEEGWAETERWSQRVTGIGPVAPLEMELNAGSGLPWLPPSIEPELGELLGGIVENEVAEAIDRLRRALLAGEKVVTVSVGEIPVRPEVIEALQRRLSTISDTAETSAVPGVAMLPLIHDNLHDLDYFADAAAREAGDGDLPATVKTTLRPYQAEAFDWQIAAWRAGLPGVLDADEQGLGKTLQTLSFLTWLTAEMRAGRRPPSPILIVAPTSLLRNWQDEIAQHLAGDALGKVHRFYGGELKQWKARRGRDIGDGEAHLDLSPLEGQIGIVVTTYQTLANYAVSLNRLRFAAVVFDEMQFVKNPRTQRAIAVKGVLADFRIGLTGTPIENRTRDLWAIIDTIAPGALGSLASFERVFGMPDGSRLAQLQDALFAEPYGRASLCRRRTKQEADPSIPPKVRFLYPRPMPPAQALRYDEARAKTGGILEVLGHIRRISAHPGMIDAERTNDFIGASARTQAVLDILRYVAARGERALVFVENLDLQAWMAELLKIEFDLSDVMVINGSTPIDERRDITRRFQRHLKQDDGFDVLLLGPRAAGTGLTLTAANHVIHLTRWWNPAVEEQCNDRTHRIGQTRQVNVHMPLAIHPALGVGSFDCLLHRLISGKRALAANILRPSGVTDGELTRLRDAAVSGVVTNDAPEVAFLDRVPGRDDLVIEMVAPEIIRITSKLWKGVVLVAAGQGVQSVEALVNDDVRHVMAVADQLVEWKSDVPFSRLTDPRLWPDFALPE